MNEDNMNQKAVELESTAIVAGLLEDLDTLADHKKDDWSRVDKIQIQKQHILSLVRLVKEVLEVANTELSARGWIDMADTLHKSGWVQRAEESLK